MRGEVLGIWHAYVTNTPLVPENGSWNLNMRGELPRDVLVRYCTVYNIT